MILSGKTIASIESKNISIPSHENFQSPETVLQFGTGVLLRGLPDYYIDKANKTGVYNGRVGVIKSTGKGEIDSFLIQDGLYTHCIKGIQNERLKEEYIINSSITQVISAIDDWEVVLQMAANPVLELIVSNTTEAGLVLVNGDNINSLPPVSFPGKLLSFLYERYQVFRGDFDKGLVIVPTELITDNGKLLKQIVLELAKQNQLDAAFIDWLDQANDFCSSLVDRIVPGKLSTAMQQEIEQTYGYTDELGIMSEPYSLWAIEATSEKAKHALRFSAADESMIITADINKYRELKLRLLNGTHTFSCGVACLAGFETVKQGMADDTMGNFVKQIMMNEIAPCVVNETISQKEALAFANKVVERFQNPFLEHKWISITLNYTQKMKQRNGALLLRHYEKNGTVPQLMALGFAAYLLFMKCEPGDNNAYFTIINGTMYTVQDEAAAYFAEIWKSNDVKTVVTTALSNTKLWDADLTQFPGFENAVLNNLESIIQNGMLKTLQSFVAA